MEEEKVHSKMQNLSRFRLTGFISNPNEFYNQKAIRSPYFPNILIFFVGLGASISKFDGKYIIANNQPSDLGVFYALTGTHWQNYWLTMTLSGIIGGYFIWLINGWWYNMRLSFIGSQLEDEQAGKLIMMCNSLIKYLPFILIALINTLRFESYAASSIDSGLITTILSLIIVITTIFSVINSYRTVKIYYSVKGLKVLFWFLILPMIFLVIAPMAVAVMSVL